MVSQGDKFMFGRSSKVEPLTREDVKKIVIETIHDVGFITAFADEIYTSLMKKTAGFMGGTQKGLNASMESNPLSNIMDSKGNVSLQGLLGAFLEGKLQGMMGQQKQGYESDLP